MSGSNIQIVELYKQGLTVAEIAESLGYDVEAVQFVLNNDMEVQKAVELANEDRLEVEFSSLETIALRTMRELLTGADKDSVRMAAAAYVMDQRLGLKKPRVDTHITFNISDFNKRLEAVKERRRQLEEATIPVASQVTTTAT